MDKHSSLFQIPAPLDLSQFAQTGLYLVFGDSTMLSLTESNIADVTRRFWEDPAKITSEVRRHEDFQPCSICPDAGKDALCHALRPILPFLEDIDRYFSYDKVVAVYKGNEEKVFHLAESEMQNALQYICILSLFSYCKVGKRYKEYYHGVIPVIGFAPAVERMYLNVYWLHNGDRVAVDRFLRQFQQDISVIIGNVLKRLNLICRKDSLLNAFYTMLVTVDLLTMKVDEALEKAFEKEKADV